MCMPTRHSREYRWCTHRAGPAAPSSTNGASAGRGEARGGPERASEGGGRRACLEATGGLAGPLAPPRGGGLTVKGRHRGPDALPLRAPRCFPSPLCS